MLSGLSIVLSWSYVIGFIIGGFTTCLIQGICLYLYFVKRTPFNQLHRSLSNQPTIDAYTFPQQLLEIISERKTSSSAASSEGSILLNLLLQFWFHENRYDINTLAAIGNRLNSELTELLTNTSLGTIFASLKVHDIELGSESPTISCIRLKDVQINGDKSMLDRFVFEFDLNYVGGFYMSIDAIVKFSSNTAFVSVKVAKCVGKVRVEFTRLPYTYWCISFLKQPELELNVESKLEGHSVPQFNRIIGVQLRRRINKKFVMPSYKIRTKPFLPTVGKLKYSDEDNIPTPTGLLQISSLSLSRLLPSKQGEISCTLIIDSNGWIDEAKSTTSYSHILQIFKKSNKEVVAALDVRKLSTGSMLVDRHEAGLRQRFRSITGQEELPSVITLDEMFRRKSFTNGTCLEAETGNVSTGDNNISSQITNVQHTKRLPYSSPDVIVFDDTFEFLVAPPSRFFNILVWNYNNMSSTNSNNTDNNGGSSRDGKMLIGFISIPLATDICCAGIGRKRRIFYLKPAQSVRPTEYGELASHPGFNSSLCNGDITFAVKFVAASADSLSGLTSSAECTPINLSPTKIPKDSALLETAKNVSAIASELNSTTHNFERIPIFTKLTNCDFCNKKIWFKDAFRCSKCAYMCHKKCVTQCEKTASECRINDDGIAAADDQHSYGEDALDLATFATPEIVMTTPENVSMSSARNKLSAFLANVKNVRRTGSASNLTQPDAIPSLPTIDSGNGSSHSLPELSGYSLPLFESTEREDEIEHAIHRLLDMPQTEQILNSVKISGQKLCVDLSLTDRQSRINKMISKIKLQIDNENVNSDQLKNRKKTILKENDEPEQGVHDLDDEIKKCEQRLQALRNLLLHCCAGLQDSHDHHQYKTVGDEDNSAVGQIEQSEVAETSVVAITTTSTAFCIE